MSSKSRCCPLHNLTKPPGVSPGYLPSVSAPLKMGMSTREVWIGLSTVQAHVSATSAVQLRMNYMH